MSILTPANAEKVNELSLSQRELVRQSLIINDSPFQSDKTYIVFDAVSGNNNLNIDVGASLSYSVLKGDGSLETLYNDTGGVKILNYAVAGQYLITIDGTFQGINTNGASQTDKDKYISILGGSNYPTSLLISSFMDCTNLESFEFSLITSIAANVFAGCLVLKNANIPLVTTIGANAFDGCVKLSDIILKNVVTIGSSAFNAVILASLIIKSASEAQALIILNAIITASGSYSVGFKFIFSSGGGSYILGSLKVSKVGNPLVVFENLGDDTANREVSINYGCDDGIGFIVKSVRPSGLTFADVFLRFISGAGNTALQLEADGSLKALITYSNTIGATNKPLSIDNAGNIGIEPDVHKDITVDIGVWNMDSTQSITIPFPTGVTIANFVSADAWIRPNSENQVNNITDDFTTGSPSGKVTASTSPSGITINRYSGGFYDNAAYNSVVINRGHLTIRYKL